MTGSVIRGGRLAYDRMVENALRGVVRDALSVVSETGLPGAHHFYITFRTHADGVEISEHLQGRYPDTMTIVLQHQFWDLDVSPDGFGVTLSFQKVPERLEIPYAAVTAFADPSANFALQFEAQAAADQDAGAPKPVTERAPSGGTDADDKPADDKPGDGGAEIVAIDAFRKKK